MIAAGLLRSTWPSGSIASAPSVALLEAAVLDQGFRDLTTDGERRVQRGRGILKHHAEPAAAYPGELAGAQSLQVDVAETQRAGNFAGIARQMAHHRPGE